MSAPAGSKPSFDYPPPPEVQALLHPSGKWTAPSTSEQPSSLSRTFNFKYFKHAWAFMSRVADECQKQKHHPEWSNTYNVVFVRWTTHKTGTLSEKDVVMARFCDAVAGEIGEIEAKPQDGAASGGRDEAATTGLEGLADAAAKDGCGPCAAGGVQR